MVAVAREIVEVFSGLVVGASVDADGIEDVIEAAFIEVVVAKRGPVLSEVAAGAIDRGGELGKVSQARAGRSPPALAPM